MQQVGQGLAGRMAGIQRGPAPPPCLGRSGRVWVLPPGQACLVRGAHSHRSKPCSISRQRSWLQLGRVPAPGARPGVCRDCRKEQPGEVVGEQNESRWGELLVCGQLMLAGGQGCEAARKHAKKVNSGRKNMLEQGPETATGLC